MTISEPTTENIAKALRVCFEKTCACSECPFEHESCGDIEQLAADRLESQERTVAELTEKLEQAELTRDMLCGTIREAEEPKTECSSTFVLESGNDIIAELTARAESAERELDAAKAEKEQLSKENLR